MSDLSQSHSLVKTALMWAGFPSNLLKESLTKTSSLKLIYLGVDFN
jgi:hypothetical protein